MTMEMQDSSNEKKLKFHEKFTPKKIPSKVHSNIACILYTNYVLVWSVKWNYSSHDSNKIQLARDIQMVDAAVMVDGGGGGGVSIA